MRHKRVVQPFSHSGRAGGAGSCAARPAFVLWECRWRIAHHRSEPSRRGGSTQTVRISRKGLIHHKALRAARRRAQGRHRRLGEINFYRRRRRGIGGCSSFPQGGGEVTTQSVVLHGGPTDTSYNISHSLRSQGSSFDHKSEGGGGDSKTYPLNPIKVPPPPARRRHTVSRQT